MIKTEDLGRFVPLDFLLSSLACEVLRSHSKKVSNTIPKGSIAEGHRYSEQSQCRRTVCLYMFSVACYLLDGV